MVLAFAFLRFRLLEIVPLARDVIFEGMHEGALVLDTNDRIIDFNPRLQAMLHDMCKKSVSFSVYEMLSAYPALLGLIKTGSPETVDLEVNRARGTYYYQAQISPLLNRRAKMVGRLITLHDHTEMRQLLNRMEELATVDDLTSAFNRRHFNELANRKIGRLQRYGGVLSLMMFDLDFYKTVNDTYGHAVGDRVLKIVVDIYRSVQRQSDILGQLGGDEFLILLPETPPQAAVIVAERLRAALEHHRMQHNEQFFAVTASFGVTGAVYPCPVSLDDLYNCADRAVYEAKDAGRNRVRRCDPDNSSPLPPAPASL